MVRIVDHLPLEALEARYRAARDATEARHYQAIWRLAQGRTVLDVAEVRAFVPRRVEELAARDNAFGPAALAAQRRRNGRAASLLSEDVLAALAERVRTPPEDGGLWTGPTVAAWIAARRGRAHVPPQRGWQALKRLNWSRRSRRRAPGLRAATPEQRAAFTGGSRPPSLRSGRHCASATMVQKRSILRASASVSVQTIATIDILRNRIAWLSGSELGERGGYGGVKIAGWPPLASPIPGDDRKSPPASRLDAAVLDALDHVHPERETRRCWYWTNGPLTGRWVHAERIPDRSQRHGRGTIDPVR